MVPRPALIIAVLTLAPAALLFMICDSDSSDAAVLNGECGKYGDNLLWSYDEDTRVLTITGSGEMRSYTPSDSRPWTSCTSVSLPDGMTSIGVDAFYGCTSLTSVTIPSSVTSIGTYAFDNCTSLTSVTIPSSVTFIGIEAFSTCTSLTSVDIPSSVTFIGGWAFSTCTSLTSVDIPSSVTSIGPFAFEQCTSLASVTIPSSVTSIADYMFVGCSSLTSVDIPSSVTSIGEGVFENCTSLSSVTIPSSVTSIGNYAFSSCTSLASVTILPSMVSIGDDAFYGCDGLTTVIVPCTNPLGLVPGSDSYGGIAKHVSELTLIHDYSAAYAWADDGKSCTVHIVCANDSEHDHDESPQVASAVKIPPTETEMGITEYSVSGVYDGFSYSSTKDVQDIPATGGGSGDEGGDEDHVLLYAAVAAMAVIGALAVCYLLFLRGRKTE